MAWGAGYSKCLPDKPRLMSRPYSLGEHGHGLGAHFIGAGLTKLPWALGTGHVQKCKVWEVPNTLKDLKSRRFFPEVFKYPEFPIW